MYGNNSHKKKVFFQAMLKRKRVKIWILFHINHFLHLVKFHLLQHFVLLTATKPLPSASSRPSWGCAPSSPSPGSKTIIRKTEMRNDGDGGLCVCFRQIHYSCETSNPILCETEPMDSWEIVCKSKRKKEKWENFHRGLTYTCRTCFLGFEWQQIIQSTCIIVP